MNHKCVYKYIIYLAKIITYLSVISSHMLHNIVHVCMFMLHIIIVGVSSLLWRLSKRKAYNKSTYLTISVDISAAFSQHLSLRPAVEKAEFLDLHFKTENINAL